MERTTVYFGRRKATLIVQTLGFAYTTALQKDPKKDGGRTTMYFGLRKAALYRHWDLHTLQLDSCQFTYLYVYLFDLP